MHLLFDWLWCKHLQLSILSLVSIARPKSLTLLLSQLLLSITFFLPNYVHTLFQKLAIGIYQCLVSRNCFQTKRLQVLSFLRIYLEQFQVFHRRQKGLCYQKNYKYLYLVRKRNDHWNKFLRVQDLVLILVVNH